MVTKTQDASTGDALTGYRGGFLDDNGRLISLEHNWHHYLNYLRYFLLSPVSPRFSHCCPKVFAQI